MDLVEGRLAHDEHEFASLFENHVGSAMNQVVAEAVRDRGQRAHAARRDHHSQCYKRAARDRRSLRTNTVALRREALYILERVWGFMCERARRPLTHDEMRLDTRPMQHLQKSHTKDRSSRPGDPYNEPRGLCLFHAASF